MIEQTQANIVDGSDTPVHFSFEYLDFPSVANRSRNRATVSYLGEKYRGEVFDLVIVIGEEALAFAEQIRARSFPDAPLLFFVVNPQGISSQLYEKKSVTGIIRKLNYVPTLKLALRQNPGTYHVVVVAGSSEAEKLEVKVAREQFREYESNLEFQYLTGLQLEELAPRLANVQPDSVILFLDFETDSLGEQFVPARILPAISKATKRPIYGTFSSLVGAGVVGGSVADLSEVGRVLGHDGARILKGEKPENIPVITGDFQHYVIDWRQLHRWGISENQVPPESVMLYWQYSPWELYRWKILGLTALVLIETVLIVWLLRSIAKRKRAQEALRRKEEELAEAQRLAQVGNWLWNPTSNAFTWSEELYHIHGLDPKLPAPSYEQFVQLFTPESWGRLSIAMEKALQTGTVQELELEVVQPNGSRRWITTRGVTLRDSTGRVTFLRGTAQDITYLKRAQQALLESEQRFRLVANTAPVMIWMSGLDKMCNYFNQPWLEFTGRPLTAELGNGWAEGVHPQDLTACLETYTKAFNARQPFQMQYRLRRHDGEYRWLFDTAVPRFDGGGSFAGYIGSCIDVTDRKHAEEALSTMGQRLIEANEQERSRIARELHDDINQRLALLANKVQEFEQATSANRSALEKKELQDLWRLTNEIATDIQHLSHQLHPSKLQYLGVAAAVRDLCKEFSRQHKFEVECVVRDLPQDLEENVSLSLFRTVQESLHNVVKHSQARHVKVELTCQSAVVLLRVSDDGVGFNPEHARNDHGLGMVSMRERLRSVGGELSIWSKPSLGTQVEGRVPATTKAARAVEGSAEQQSKTGFNIVSFDSSRDRRA